jgi:hypothetical protein
VSAPEQGVRVRTLLSWLRWPTTPRLEDERGAFFLRRIIKGILHGKISSVVSATYPHLAHKTCSWQLFIYSIKSHHCLAKSKRHVRTRLDLWDISIEHFFSMFQSTKYPVVPSV